MQYRPLINADFNVSILSMGCASIGQDYPPGKPGVYGNDARKLLRAAVAAGVNLFHTDVSYGDGWRLVLEEAPADALIVMKSEPGVPDYRIRIQPQGEVWPGDKIPWGWTAYEQGEVGGALSLGIKVLQYPFNLIDQRFSFVTAFENQVGTIGRSPLLRGKLSGMAEEALRFALFGGPDTCLLGISSEKELDFALECIEKGPIEYEDIIDPRRWEK